MRRFLTALLLLVVTSGAFASFAAPTMYYTSNGPQGAAARYSTKEALCEEAKSLKQAQHALDTTRTGWAIDSLTEISCIVGSSINGTRYTNSYAVGTIVSCPPNSTFSGGQCTCASTFTQVQGAQGAQCNSNASIQVDECEALAKAQTFAGTPLVHFGPVGLTACLGGWPMRGSGGAAGGGQSELYGPFQCAKNNDGTVTSCTVTPKPTTQAAACPAGSFPGTVGGVQVCSPNAATNSVQGTSTTSVTPSVPTSTQTSVTPGTGDPSAPAGTTEVTKVTVCTGLTCVTTTTYKGPDGTSKGSKTEEKPKVDYCAENPLAAGCKKVETKVGGSCKTFSCADGDAAMCAIAKATELVRCAVDVEDNNAEVNAYNTAAAAGTATGIQSSTVAITQGSFSSANALNVAASCVGDLNITVFGKSVTLPLSTVCPYLSYLGTLMLALSFLSAFFIVGRPT